MNRCAFCDSTATELIPASLQPGTDLYKCADTRACMTRNDEISDANRP